MGFHINFSAYKMMSSRRCTRFIYSDLHLVRRISIETGKYPYHFYSNLVRWICYENLFSIILSLLRIRNGHLPSESVCPHFVPAKVIQISKNSWKERMFYHCQNILSPTANLYTISNTIAHKEAVGAGFTCKMPSSFMNYTLFDQVFCLRWERKSLQNEGNFFMHSGA